MEGAKLESFLLWAAELGISDSPTVIQSDNLKRLRSCLGHSLRVSNFPDAGGRGFAAARDLRKGELILRVPKTALMTSHSLMKDRALSIALQKHSSLSSSQILTVALLYEVSKGKRSWWYPYLVQLPRSYDTLASFGAFEIQALQVGDAIWAAEKAVEKVELEWKQAIAPMDELKLKPQLLTFKAWLWASATISSRTMHIPWDDAGCLCPVGDFFNYAAPGEESFNTEDIKSWRVTFSMEVSLRDTMEKSNAELLDADLLRLIDAGYEENIGAYCFYARQNYKEGDQVLLSYGTYTNLELVEHYGFLLGKNPNDKAFISLEPDMYSLCSSPTNSMFIDQNGKPSFALLGAVRLWATPPNQRKSVRHLACSGYQLSADNELIVMVWIAKNCNAVLQNFQTSIEEEKLLLSTINSLQDGHTLLELEEVSSLTFKGEVRAFLDANDLLNRGTDPSSLISSKARRLIDRWKLAVLWRIRYKEILIDCIAYCTEIANSLTSQKLVNL